MAQDLQVVSDFYDLTLYLVGRIEKFPRQHRYSLGMDMERRLQGILALLIKARYVSQRGEKAELLSEANVELEVLRFQLRLAKDLAALPHASHGHAISLVGSVGAQVGGWLRAMRKPPETRP